MKAWTLMIVLAASVLAVLLAYLASPHQRRLRRPLAAFPARVSASMAAIVALRGWVDAFGMVAGMFAWLASVSVVAVVGYWLAARGAAAQRRTSDSELHSLDAR